MKEEKTKLSSSLWLTKLNVVLFATRCNLSPRHEVSVGLGASSGSLWTRGNGLGKQFFKPLFFQTKYEKRPKQCSGSWSGSVRSESFRASRIRIVCRNSDPYPTPTIRVLLSKKQKFFKKLRFFGFVTFLRYRHTRFDLPESGMVGKALISIRIADGYRNFKPHLQKEF